MVKLLKSEFRTIDTICRWMDKTFDHRLRETAMLHVQVRAVRPEEHEAFPWSEGRSEPKAGRELLGQSLAPSDFVSIFNQSLKVPEGDFLAFEHSNQVCLEWFSECSILIASTLEVSPPFKHTALFQSCLFTCHFISWWGSFEITCVFCQ